MERPNVPQDGLEVGKRRRTGAVGMPEPLLTPQELATWLNMSRVWVYKQAEKGLIPFHRVGEAIRFNPLEIQAYLDARRSLKRTYVGCRTRKERKRTNDHLGHQQEVTKNN